MWYRNVQDQVVSFDTLAAIWSGTEMLAPTALEIHILGSFGLGRFSGQLGHSVHFSWGKNEL